MSNTDSYCLKCKKKTETVDPCEKVTEGAKAKSVLLQGKCAVCGCKKSKLLSSKRNAEAKNNEVNKEEKPKKTRKPKKSAREEDCE